MRTWVPEDHRAHSVLDAVESLPLRTLRVNERGTGDEQFPPRRLLGLVSDGNVTGTFSSRAIERATDSDVAVRFLTGDTHPDHDTCGEFRRQNAPVLAESFVRILELARALKRLKFSPLPRAAAGTKVLASASQPHAVSYQRAAQEPPAYAAKPAERAARRTGDEKVCGCEPQLPSTTPSPKDQFNLTDPERRSLKASNGSHFAQAHNVQAAVEKTGQPRSVADLEQCPEPPFPLLDAGPVEQMRNRFQTTAGRALDRLRQQTVEPVFGSLTEALGFRRFSRRDLARVELAWMLVCLAYNRRRFHR